MSIKLALPTNEEKVQKDIELSESLKTLNAFLDERIKCLKLSRKKVLGNLNIDKLMDKADEDTRIRDFVGDEDGKGKKYLFEDETLGWRGISSFVDLSKENWQSHVASNEPFIKLMIALSVLFDNDPRYKLSAGGEKFVAINEVVQQLLDNSWKVQMSREQLKSFIFDLAKYPFAVGRTFIKQEIRTISEIVEYNPRTKETKEEEREIQNFAEVMRRRLDPRRVWLDDKAKANDRDSINDWCFEEDYSYEQLQREFGETKYFDQIARGGSPNFEIDEATGSDRILPTDTNAGGFTENYLVQIYENKAADRLVARVKIQNGWIPLVNDPLPWDHKELSLWTTFWNMRDPNTPYGVAPVEIMRGDKTLKNQIKNMTIDQIILSIYKMALIENTGVVGGKTKIKLSPGKFEEVKGKVSWLEVPGPGQDAKYALDYEQGEIDGATGIQPVLQGELSGKTAFEVGQAKEASLKRLKLPLDNIIYALRCEGRLSKDLLYQAATIPLVEQIVNPEDILAYRQEVGDNPEFFDAWTDTETNLPSFYARRYKEFSLKVKQDDKGIYVPSEDNMFFKMPASFIRWEGDIDVEPMSLLSTWEELEKRQTQEFGQVLIEFLKLGPEIALKPVTQMLEKFKFNPKKWLPDAWLYPKPHPLAVAGAQLFGEQNLPGNLRANGESVTPSPIIQPPTSTAVAGVNPINGNGGGMAGM